MIRRGHKDYLNKISRTYSEVVHILKREKELLIGEKELQVGEEDGFTLHLGL